MPDISNLRIQLFSSNPPVYQALFSISAVPQGGLETIQNFEIQWRYQYINGSYGYEDQTVAPNQTTSNNYQTQLSAPDNIVGLWVRGRIVATDKAAWKTTGWTNWVAFKVDDDDPIDPSRTLAVSFGDIETEMATIIHAKIKFNGIDASTIPQAYRKYITLTVYISKNNADIVTFTGIKINFNSSGIGYADLSFGCAAGVSYEAWCQAVYENASNTAYSLLSDHSTPFGKGPAIPEFKVDFCGTKSGHEIYLEWNDVSADTYDIVWASKGEYLRLFDIGLSTLVTGITNVYTLIDVGTGGEYWFMVRALDEHGNTSDWSWPIKRTVGATPGVPSTWSNKSKFIISDDPDADILLNWVHSSTDGSREYYAHLVIDINTGDETREYNLVLSKEPQTEVVDDVSVYPAGKDWLDESGQIRPNYSGSEVYVNQSPSNEITRTSVTDISYVTVNKLFNYDGQDVVYDSVTTFNLSDFIRTKQTDPDPGEEPLPPLTYGASISWKVQTAGAWMRQETPVFGGYSITRVINCYTKPIINAIFTYSNTNPSPINTVTRYPFYLYAFVDNHLHTNQVPIYYLVEIKPRTSYTRVNINGTTEMITPDTVIFRKELNNVADTSFFIEFNAGDLVFENGIAYDAYVTVVTNAGTDNVTSQHVVMNLSGSSDEVQVGADLYYDNSNAVAYVRPFVFEEVSAVPSEYRVIEYLTGYYLSIYRINSDNTLSEVIKNVVSQSEFIEMRYYCDPYPTMGNMAYRIVAVHRTTGRVIFGDFGPLNNNEKGIIIQWGDMFSSVAAVPDPAKVVINPGDSWAGNMLRLPYNVDVTEKSSVDVTKVNYIGRTSPVTYYGTAVNSSWSIKADIDISDTKSIMLLRKLAEYPGDVYFRESSGMGFWATVTVSFPRNHLAVATTVNIDVTKVSGAV